MAQETNLEPIQGKAHIKIYTKTDFETMIKVFHEYGFTEKPERPYLFQNKHGGKRAGYIGAEEYAGRDWFEFWPESMYTPNEEFPKGWNSPSVIPANNFDLCHFIGYINMTRHTPQSMIFVHAQSIYNFTKAVSEGDGSFLEAVSKLEEVYYAIGTNMKGPGFKMEKLERLISITE